MSYLTSSSALRLCVWLFNDCYLQILCFNQGFLLAFRTVEWIAIQIQMIKFLSHKHTSTSLASLYWKAGERTNLQKGTKISVPLFLMIRLSSLNHFKMLQCILYRFHFLRCRMFPRLFQFFYRIRSIIHWQA